MATEDKIVTPTAGDPTTVATDLRKQATTLDGVATQLRADADSLETVPVPIPPNPTPGTKTLGQHFGAFSMPLEQVQGTSDSFINQQGDLMADLGVGWWRGDFPLYLWNPNKGQYNFGAADHWIKAGLARNIKPLPICYMLAPYLRANNSGDKSPPNSDADFATALVEAAKYFKSIGVTAMEVWNEQNLSGFWTGTAATDDAYRGKYCRMMAAAYPRIKAAVPDMIVVSGGLSTADTVWDATHQPNPPGCGALSTIKSYADKGLFRNCDAVGWHPYLDTDTACKDVGSWPSWSPKAVQAALDIIDGASNGGLSLWTTETGCPRSAVGGSQAEQSKRIKDAYNAYMPGGCLSSLHARLGPFFSFCVVDRTTGNGREDSFGWQSTSGSKYAVYNDMKPAFAQPWTQAVAAWAM
jgi:hypothetical protein